MMRKRTSGFSLIELLTVLAIIGIIAGFAVPAFLGQRQRARVIGDAQSNARVLSMALEARKAENGTYGTGGPYNWYPNGTGNGLTWMPNFTPQGSSKMDYTVTLGANGLTYVLTVFDSSRSKTTPVYRVNQNGAKCDESGKPVS